MIKKLTAIHTRDMARLHHEGMPNDFLPSFGYRFLELLHKHLINAPHLIAIGFFQDNELCGYIVGSKNTSITMGNVMKKGFLEFLPHIIYKVFRSPHTIKYLFETLFYGKSKEDSVKPELIILTISSHWRRKGIGTILIKELKKEFLKQKIHVFQVGTLSTNNPANTFYLQNGGLFNHSYQIFDRTWNVYHYTLHKSSKNLK